MSLSLLQPARPDEQPWYHVGGAISALTKAGLYKPGAAPETVYSLSGQLFLSQSGWLLLSVPNALGRGAFDALHEPGIELPTKDTDDPNSSYRAHISVMSADEVAKLGGGDKISERGHTFHYTTGPVKEISPTNWNGVSRVWAIEVYSPELKALRRSYGLSALPHNGEYQFHITIAIRRTHVLSNSPTRKAAVDESVDGFKATATALARRVTPKIVRPETRTNGGRFAFRQLLSRLGVNSSGR